MKKLLLIVTLLLTFTLTGCNSFYSQDEVDLMLEESNQEFETTIEGLYDLYIEENAQNIEELQLQIEELQPTQVQRFMNEMMEYAITDGSMVFMELSVNYPEQVEAYGYSATYVYEALEEMDLIITITVDNDLEFCYYPDGYIDEPICEDLIEGTETFNVSINQGFFVLEFESWDEVDDSNLVIMILEEQK
jgi:hypothetical protein